MHNKSGRDCSLQKEQEENWNIAANNLCDDALISEIGTYFYPDYLRKGKQAFWC